MQLELQHLFNELNLVKLLDQYYENLLPLRAESLIYFIGNSDNNSNQIVKIIDSKMKIAKMKIISNYTFVQKGDVLKIYNNIGDSVDPICVIQHNYPITTFGLNVNMCVTVDNDNNLTITNIHNPEYIKKIKLSGSYMIKEMIFCNNYIILNSIFNTFTIVNTDTLTFDVVTRFNGYSEIYLYNNEIIYIDKYNNVAVHDIIHNEMSRGFRFEHLKERDIGNKITKILVHETKLFAFDLYCSMLCKDLVTNVESINIRPFEFTELYHRDNFIMFKTGSETWVHFDINTHMISYLCGKLQINNNHTILITRDRNTNIVQILNDLAIEIYRKSFRLDQSVKLCGNKIIFGSKFDTEIYDINTRKMIIIDLPNLSSE